MEVYPEGHRSANAESTQAGTREPEAKTTAIYRKLTNEERARERSARLRVKLEVEEALEQDLARRAEEAGLEKIQSPVRFPQFIKRFNLAGVFLLNIFFWDTKGVNCDGWFWKPKADIMRETGLSVQQQDKHRRQLEDAGVIETKRGKGNVLHYRMNFVGLMQSLNLEFSSNRWGENQKPPQGVEPDLLPGDGTSSHNREEISNISNASDSSSVSSAGAPALQKTKERKKKKGRDSSTLDTSREHATPQVDTRNEERHGPDTRGPGKKTASQEIATELLEPHMAPVSTMPRFDPGTDPEYRDVLDLIGNNPHVKRIAQKYRNGAEPIDRLCQAICWELTGTMTGAEIYQSRVLQAVEEASKSLARVGDREERVAV